MDRWHNLIGMQLAMIFTIGLIGIECAVLWLTLDYYYCFILGILVITYFIELGFYIKIKYETKPQKKVDKRKRVE